ncbi:MAG: hypothetical protein AB7O52_00295 [Planctomycetota bacterium]
MARAINADDKYRERLLKHIPSEVLGVYLAAAGLITSLDDPPVWLLWVLFGLCLVATPFWLVFFMDVKSVLQNVLGCVAFIIWVMTLTGGPFERIDGFETYIGSILLLVFTGLVAPLVAKLCKN